jgi:hypothetical protein
MWGLGIAIITVASAEDGCLITAHECVNFPSLSKQQFRDSVGEDHFGTATNEANCLKRAEDLHSWCGNQGEVKIAATFLRSGRTHVYQPSICDKGWSVFGPFCYKHFWERLTWWDALKSCEAAGGSLASIHSKLENSFIMTLTKGLSAWFGYQDIDQDQNWDWTDKTEDNFNNFAKNCTGREHEPECAPEEKAQQWYDWEGHDLGTYLCKKPAKKPNDLFVTTPEYLLRVDLRSALPLESPQTLRLAENNRTLDLPLAVGSRKPLADLGDIPLSIGATGAKGAFKPLSAWR